MQNDRFCEIALLSAIRFDSAKCIYRPHNFHRISIKLKGSAICDCGQNA